MKTPAPTQPRLALQELSPIQILLIFLRFELPLKFIFQCYRRYISSIHKVPSIKLWVGRSRDPLLQRPIC